MSGRLPVTDINEHLICNLCDGYLINATTIIECLHSFCRTCIVRYLEANKYCPICEVQVHKTKPLLSIRPDQTLQDIVYKMVPGLYQNEMQKRKEFYAEHPEAASRCTAEERGEGDPRFFFPDESISLNLSYRCKDIKPEESEDGVVKDTATRYLKCPAAVTIAHLKKFIVYKFSLPLSFTVDISYVDNVLRDEYRLMDVAYIYAWRRAEPMDFFYSIRKRVPKPKELPLPVVSTPVIPNDSEKSLDDKPEVATEEKMEVEEEKPAEEVSAADIPPSEGEKAEPEVQIPVSSSSSIDVQNMDITEPNSSTVSSSPTEKPPLVAIAKPTYNSVKFVSAPTNALLAPKNGICLKFIHDPELNPKTRSKKSGRKSGRSSRHKSVPKRFARLAPYPPPSVPVTCLTTQPITHLSQITVGKLVPSVMSSLAPTIVTTLVSTTANNTVYNNSQNSAPSPFLNQPVSNVVTSSTDSRVSEIPATTPNLIATTSSNSAVPSPLQAVGLSTSVASLQSVADSLVTKELSNKAISKTAAGSTKETVTNDVTSKTPPPVKDSQKSNPPASVTATALTVSNTSTVSTIPVSSCVTAAVTSLNLVSSSNDKKGNTRNEDRLAGNKELKTQKETPESSHPPQESSVPMDEDSSKSPSLSKVIFENSISKTAESFEQSVKNSISAEFSDNDDLGCQHDLVVDEQRMDEDEDNDISLRKTINELAKKVDETDDIEADSGRGSDLSCPARGEDDRDSPAAIDVGTPAAPPTSVTSVTTSSAATTTPSDTSNPRYVKSNNINHVINNLYKHFGTGRPAASSTLPKSSTPEQPSTKDDGGALDLSTCTRKSGEVPISRPKPVANPVLDIKHRQQTYLPAPNKQHTACPPAPKHPTSGMLHHGNSILHSHLTNPKPTHLQVPYNNLPFPIHTGRVVSSPSTCPDRSPPLYNHKMASVPPHQNMVGMLPPGMLPYASMMNNLASYAGRNVGPSLQNRCPSSNSLHKDVTLSSPSAVASKSSFTYGKPATSSRKSSDSHLSSSPNSRGLSSPSVAPSHPRTSPSMLRMSPHHRSASPAPSPQAVAPSNNLAASSLAAATSASHYKPSVPIYKKSDSVSKNHNYKFKGSSNLTVINPDPNGYRQKIVIRNLDFRPNHR